MRRGLPDVNPPVPSPPVPQWERLRQSEKGDDGESEPKWRGRDGDGKKKQGDCYDRERKTRETEWDRGRDTESIGDADVQKAPTRHVETHKMETEGMRHKGKKTRVGGDGGQKKRQPTGGLGEGPSIACDPGGPLTLRSGHICPQLVRAELRTTPPPYTH